ncbi:MAG: tetratricopeptide repeat protein [Candidatus Odinarchaeota archaeon]
MVKLTIRKRILLAFLLLLIIPVTFLAGLNTAEIVITSDINAKESGKALVEEELANLDRLAADEGAFIEETFQQYVAEVKMLDSYTEALFSEAINATPRSSYYWNEAGPGVPGWDGKYNADYDSQHISFNVSCYYIPPDEIIGGNAYTFDPETDLTTGMERVINSSSNMDNAFRDMHEANPDYIWIYGAFEEGHIFRNYPFDKVDYFLNWNEDGSPFDHYLYDWYNNATSLTGDQTAFTSPYFDVVGLLITISRPVRYPNDTLIGVVAADIKLETLKTSILGLKVLDNGYAFLLDDTGEAISHPGIDEELAIDEGVPPISELETSQTSSAFNGIVNDMKSGQQGRDSFIKNGEKWYISYYPINTLGTHNYSLALVVPEADIIAPAVAIQNRITSLAFFQALLFLLLLAVVIVVIVFVGAVISRKIVEPVKELTRMVSYIAEGDLSRELRGDSAEMGKEVGMLHASFNNLLTSLRFGNTDYYRGDLDRAYQNYRKALELFTTTKNDRGVAIAKNNLGNIYRAWNDFDNAFKNYQEAIDIGREQGDKKGLASRYNNLALLYLERENYSTALDILESAKKLDEEIGNQKGLATRFENLGLVHQRMGKKEIAEDYYRRAVDISKTAKDSWGLANAHISLGSLYLEMDRPEEAREYIEEALGIAKTTEDIQLALLCLESLSRAYDQLDMRAESHRARVQAEELRKRLANAKSVLFVLDYSGSMSGRRIKAARNGALSVFKSQINPQDEVGIVIFNHQSRVLLDLIPVENNEEKIEETIRNLRYPESVTAFYDAVGDGIEILERKKGNEQKWLIALTDGEDNSSERYTIKDKRPGLLERLFPSIKLGLTSIPGYIRETLLNVNLIIIGVGSEVFTIERDLSQLCADSPRGKYIPLAGDDVDRTIEEAFEEVSEEMARVEVEGFTFSDD